HRTQGAVNPLPLRQGTIVDLHGRILGMHRGIHTVTVGQRRGLTIASAHPLYVIDINAARNEVIVGRDEEQFFTGLVARGVTWHLPANKVVAAIKATVKIRYRHGGVESDLYPSPGDKNRVTVIFSSPQKAVAPGQAAVFYRGDEIIGGGWIERGIRDE
ncbi:MAG: tRNA 2-thiouridine(34) synthase MnmA, partial [Deltaproteobacteria bacterium]|nr:tRNA 2-thiouridine(34) synthase MnmA [Deltaproteobacteria bacterium]